MGTAVATCGRPPGCGGSIQRMDRDFADAQVEFYRNRIETLWSPASLATLRAYLESKLAVAGQGPACIGVGATGKSWGAANEIPRHEAFDHRRQSQDQRQSRACVLERAQRDRVTSQGDVVRAGRLDRFRAAARKPVVGHSAFRARLLSWPDRRIGRAQLRAGRDAVDSLDSSTRRTAGTARLQCIAVLQPAINSIWIWLMVESWGA